MSCPSATCQLSLRVKSGKTSGKEIFNLIEAAGVTCDWREPDILRVAPVPLYNSFVDVHTFADKFLSEMNA